MTPDDRLARWDRLHAAGRFGLPGDGFVPWDARVTGYADGRLVFEIAGRSLIHAPTEAHDFIVTIDDDTTPDDTPWDGRGSCTLEDRTREDSYDAPDESAVLTAIADGYAEVGDRFGHLQAFEVEFGGHGYTIRPTFDDYRDSGAAVSERVYDQDPIGIQDDLFRVTQLVCADRVWRPRDGTEVVEHRGLSVLSETRPSDHPLWRQIAEVLSGWRGQLELPSEAELQLHRDHRPLFVQGKQVTDIEVAEHLPDLEFAVIERTAVDDLRPLARCPGLTSVTVEWSPVGSVVPLAGLRNLRRVDLTGTDVSDVSALPGRVEILTLAHTAIEDLESVRDLRGLMYLNLDWTAVTDLRPLVDLPHLGTLSLSATDVTDLEPLTGVRALSGLSLDRLDIDVSVLRRLPRLARLTVRGRDDVRFLLDLAALQEVRLCPMADPDVVAALRDRGVRVSGGISE